MPLGRESVIRYGRPVPTPPRRFFYGYVVVAAAFVLSFASGPGQSFLFSVFQPEILRDTGLSATRFSLIYALGSGFSAALVLVLGRALDRFGARAVSFVLALLLIGASAGMAMATGFFSLLVALAVLRAIGQGCLITTSQVLTSQWFVTRRGFALSLTTMGVVCSNALLPPLCYTLIAHLGWRTTYLWMGGILGGLIMILAVAVIRNRPEDLGLHPDGAAEPIPEDPGTGPARPSRRGIWKTGLFWSLVLPLCVPPFVSTATIFHQVSIFAGQGLDSRVSANLLTVFAIAAGAGALLTGGLIDRAGVRNTTLLSLLFLALSTIALIFASNPAVATVYALLMGLSLGIWSVTNSASWPHYYGREGLGSVQGSATMVLLTAAALAPLPVASLQAATGSHRAGLLALLAVCVAALVITASRPRLSH